MRAEYHGRAGLVGPKWYHTCLACLLTSAVPIYFGTDGHRFVTMQGGRAFTLLPRVEIARRVFRKKERKKQSNVSLGGRSTGPSCQMKLPFPASCGPDGLQCVSPRKYRVIPNRTRLSRPQMLPPPWPRWHHARGLSCAVCMRGSPT